jgi:hypothetical protein
VRPRHLHDERHAHAAVNALPVACLATTRAVYESLASLPPHVRQRATFLSIDQVIEAPVAAPPAAPRLPRCIKPRALSKALASAINAAFFGSGGAADAHTANASVDTTYTQVQCWGRPAAWVVCPHAKRSAVWPLTRLLRLAHEPDAPPWTIARQKPCRCSAAAGTAASSRMLAASAYESS